MFISLGYLLFYAYQYFFKESKKMYYYRLLKYHIDASSIVFRNLHHTALLTDSKYIGSPCSKFLEDCKQNYQENVLVQTDAKQILSVSPQMNLNLKNWTSYLDRKVQTSHGLDSHVYHVLFETYQTKDMEVFLQQSLSVPRNKQVKVVDCVRPIAWQAGSPFGIVAESSAENLATLATAFMDGTLMLDDMLELVQLISVRLEGKACNLLPPAGSSQSPFHSPVSSCANILENLSTVSVTGIPIQHELYEGSNESMASSVCDSQEMFTVSQLLVAPNGPVSDCEFSLSDMNMDSFGGEAPSGPLEELAPEILTPIKRKKRNKNKPPNILIYCGKKDSTRLFEAVKHVVNQCINLDKYAVYNLKHEHVSTVPWAENTVMLIISSEKVYDGTDQAFLNYFLGGGTIVSFSSYFDSLFLERVQTNNTSSVLSLCYKHWKDVTAICGCFEYRGCSSLLPDINVQTLATNSMSGREVMVEVTHDISDGVAVLSQVNLDKDPMELAINPDIFAALKQANPTRFEILKDLFITLGLECSLQEVPVLTSAKLITINKWQMDALMASLQPRLKDGVTLNSRNITLHFLDKPSNSYSDPVTENSIPVHLNTCGNFNFDVYKKHLDTQVLGKAVLYADVIGSTMNVFDGLMFSIPEDIGLVAVAGRQTSGKGRGGNTWLSPAGCAMFSVHVRLPISSRLGQKVAYVQHMAGLAVIQAVCSLAGYEALELSLKWPNDLYFGSVMKIGGVLVQSTVMKDTIHAVIGCGINVSNKDPTVCVNDLICQYNKQNGTNLECVTTEEVIARSLTILENLITEFQNHGHQAFLQLYYTRWLHSDALVRLENETGPQVRVIGLDDHGYLSVRTEEGAVMSLQPDGNSFDMMRNLVHMKVR